MPHQTSILRRIAIKLNGEARQPIQPPNLPDDPDPQARRARSLCMPSHGGLANPDWKFDWNTDLRERFSGKPLSEGVNR